MNIINNLTGVDSKSNAPEKGKSILIVDDNEINQKLLRVYLSSMGYQVLIANDGYAALDILQNHSIDLIFLDLHMPIMNGYETTKAIRSLNNDYKFIPIIGLSADGLPNSLRKALEIGMDEYLVKPIKQDDLQQILAKWLPSPIDEPVPNPPPAAMLSKADDLRLMLMKEMPDYKRRLADALAANDYQEIYEVAHRITGGSAYCELPELNKIADLLQTAAKCRSSEYIELYSEQLLEHINHLLRDLPAIGHG